MIAFTASREDFDHPPGVYLMDNDGGNLRRLTDESLGGYTHRPHWSPDGRQLLFVAQFRTARNTESIYIIDIDTLTIRQLPLQLRIEHIFPQIWLPNGQIIFQDAYRNIRKVQFDGTGLQDIKGLSDHYHDFYWGADGQAMVLMEQLFAGGQFCIANADGTNLRRITDEADAEVSSMPKLSPDGQKIAFVKWDEDKDLSILYVMNSDGTNRRYLDCLSGILPPIGGSDFVWSPDSTQLVYNGWKEQVVEDKPLEEQTGDMDCLCAMNVDGTNWHLLATPTEFIDFEMDGFDPAWSNDGQWVYFILPEEGEYDHIYCVRADGTDVQQLIGDEHRLESISSLAVQPQM